MIKRDKNELDLDICIPLLHKIKHMNSLTQQIKKATRNPHAWHHHLILRHPNLQKKHSRVSFT